MRRNNLSSAVVGGVVGAALMSVLMGLARGGGIPVSLETVLGSAVTGRTDALTWFLGLLVHLAIGAAFGALYASLFRVARRVGPWFGGMLGAWHGMFAGLLLGGLPRVHPAIPEQLAAPGPLYAFEGTGAVVVFFAMHVVYGAVVGLACRRMVRARLDATLPPPEVRAPAVPTRVV